MRFALSLSLSLLCLPPLGARERINLAVVPVERGRGVPANISSYVQSLLEAELSRSGRFNLVERTRLKEVLEELGFQQSGLTDPEKAAEIGRQLNAGKLLFGEVLRLYPGYELSVRIVDVQTNKVLHATEEALGARTDSMAAPVRRLARRLIAAASLLAPVEMVFFPAAEFDMGSAAGLPDAAPVHKVSLSAFYLDSREVSRVAFLAFREARGEKSLLPEHPEHPSTGASWWDAAAYCQWQGKRLPTEAEWEYAARHSAGPPPAAQSPRGPVAVGAPPPGLVAAAGAPRLLHMADNAAEWVQDWWDPGYYARSPKKNPTGPAEGDYKVVRGGSWEQPPTEGDPGFRAYHAPNRGAAHIGFRCARSAGTPPR